MLWIKILVYRCERPQVKAIEAVARPPRKQGSKLWRAQRQRPLEKPHFLLKVSKMRKPPRFPAKTVWHARSLSTGGIKRIFKDRIFGCTAAGPNSCMQQLTLRLSLVRLNFQCHKVCLHHAVLEILGKGRFYWQTMH